MPAPKKFHQTFEFPIYAMRFYEDLGFFVAGGGGIGKNGVRNKLVKELTA